MKIRSPWIIRQAARVAVLVLKLLFRTVRVQLRASDPCVIAYDYDGPQRFLYCFWHDSLLFPIFTGKPKHMSALVSRHADGSYLADAMEMVNITPIRGSSNRGGAAAVRQLMDVARVYHITVTPDVPRGPRRTMKSGIVYLASRTGNPIVPGAYVCPSSWRIRGSWTDMVVPKPGARVYAILGEPIKIPPRLSREQLDDWTELVQQKMDQLDDQAARLSRGEEPVFGSPSNRAA